MFLEYFLKENVGYSVPKFVLAASAPTFNLTFIIAASNDNQNPSLSQQYVGR